jgi:ppGpp synthetase/RelA/SpoT-type nucleotidyltranferase
MEAGVNTTSMTVWGLTVTMVSVLMESTASPVSVRLDLREVGVKTILMSAWEELTAIMAYALIRLMAFSVTAILDILEITVKSLSMRTARILAVPMEYV